ncbi:DUF418 domain-containing protein [Gemmatimonadota bacterium]
MALGDPSSAPGLSAEGGLPRPVSARERSLTLDAIRGLAVLGMLVANVLIFALSQASRDLASVDAGSGRMALAILIGLLVDGKFHTLFAVLFGMGMAMQSRRAREQGAPFTGFFLRRMGVLFLFGTLHSLLLSSVDILAFYALIGALALPVRNLSSRLLGAGAVSAYVIGLGLLGVSAVRSPDGSLPGEPRWAELAGSAPGEGGSPSVSATLLPAVAEVLDVPQGELFGFLADEERILRQGTFAEGVKFRALVTYGVDLPLRITYLSWRLWALFLVGILLGRRGVFMEAGEGRASMGRLALACGLGGILLQGVGGATLELASGSILSLSIALLGVFIGAPLLSLGYAGAVAAVLQRKAALPLFRGLGAVGRMALTNYVGQSVVLAALFFSQGLGLFGRLSPEQALLLTLPIGIGQIVFSLAWLSAFRFGPLEWAWRSLSYGRLLAWQGGAPFRGRWLVLLPLLLTAAGCEADPASPSDSPENPETHTDSWVFHTPYDWTHDGMPYAGQHVTIYSDAASDEMKGQLAEIADGRFHQILALFDYEDLADLRYPPGSSTIDIYLNLHHPETVNWAYWAGFIITIRSPEISGFWYDYTVYTVRHELTHEFEFLIEGRGGLGTDVWFREGLAVHVGCMEGTGLQPVRSLSELDAWIGQNQDVPGGGNPIGIHQHTDLPQGADLTQYYRVFGLAVTYLLDEAGRGRSYGDVLALFYDVRAGRPFPASFEDRFGISLSAFEGEFFERARAYLGTTP